MLDWTILIFLAGGSSSFVARSTGLSSSGSGLFREDLFLSYVSMLVNWLFHLVSAGNCGLTVLTVWTLESQRVGHLVHDGF